MDKVLPPVGTKVLCHKNLNKGVWSISVGGKVMAHVPEVMLANVTFRVRELARQQVIERKCRQVHCWALGTIAGDVPAGVRTPISYNPYRAATFTRRSDGAPVHGCEYVHFTRIRARSPLAASHKRDTGTVPLLTNFETVEDDEVKQSAARPVQPDEAPTTEFGTVVDFPGSAGTAPPNVLRKPSPAREGRREWLTEAEVERLCAAARKRGRWGHRDTTMILLAYRHGLRVAELVALKWQHVDLETGRLRVIRSKGSDDSVQPLSGAEIRALRRIRREQQTGERYVFVSERGAPLTANGFFKMLRRAALSIGMDDVHPHLLRHACGYKLVNQGVDTRTLAAYLGHRQIANTARYTKMDAHRFDRFWQD